MNAPGIGALLLTPSPSIVPDGVLSGTFNDPDGSLSEVACSLVVFFLGHKLGKTIC